MFGFGYIHINSAFVYTAPRRKDQAVLDLAGTGETGGFGMQKGNAFLTLPVVQ